MPVTLMDTDTFTQANGGVVAKTLTYTVPSGLSRYILLIIAESAGTNAVVTGLPTIDDGLGGGAVAMDLLFSFPATTNTNRQWVWGADIADAVSGTVSIVLTRDTTAETYAGIVASFDNVDPAAPNQTASTNTGANTTPAQLSGAAAFVPTTASEDLVLILISHSDGATCVATNAGDGTEQVSVSELAGSTFRDQTLILATSIGDASVVPNYTMSATGGTLKWRCVVLALNYLAPAGGGGGGIVTLMDHYN